MDSKILKRCGVNYIDKLEYYVYKNYEEFVEKIKIKVGFIFLQDMDISHILVLIIAI